MSQLQTLVERRMIQNLCLKGAAMLPKRARLILCAVMTLAFASSARAGHWEAGTHAYSGHDYLTALKEWQAGADAGEIDSVYELGVMFREGQGVPKDAVKAFDLNMRAAEAGYYLALNNMGGYYHEGIGVKADDVEATRWVRRAADQANSSAMRMYAWALRTGAGVKPDKAAAVEWYERSFLYDDFTAANILMVSERDWRKYPFTRNEYDDLLEKGLLPKTDLAARFRATVARADADDAEAQFETAMMYFIGRGTKANPTKAVEYLQRAADHGHAMAQFRLANTYIQGIGGNASDEKKAAYWLYQSALQKNPFALSLLGSAYLGGRGVPEDGKSGFALLEVGAFYGDPDTAKIVMHARLNGPAERVDASDAIAYKCVAQGMKACSPTL